MTSWARSVRTGAAAFALAALGACSGSDGGAAGTGGAAAGSGGNPGCTSAPNCGGCEACFDTCLCNGGAADACLLKCTSGSGGSAGSGGSGATGGATGGSGGSTGGSGGSGGVPCTEVTTSSPSCNTCIHGACCSQIESCFNDPACGGLANCLSSYCASAADLSACASQYCGQYGAGVNAYNTMAQCFANNCASAC
jgi:hypothetical protein